MVLIVSFRSILERGEMQSEAGETERLPAIGAAIRECVVLVGPYGPMASEVEHLQATDFLQSDTRAWHFRSLSCLLQFGLRRLGAGFLFVGNLLQEVYAPL